MRWRSRLYLRDREGETRIRQRFCFVPWMFGGHWFWLQTLLVVETITRIDVGGSCEWGVYAWRWRPTKLDADT